MQPKAKVLFNQEADFRQERDFGAKVSATFDFVAANFRPLVKCLAYFVLPGALLGGIGTGLFLGDFMTLLAKTNGTGNLTSYPGENPFTGSSYAGIGLSVVGFLVAFLLLSSTVYGFVRVRMRTPPGEVVEPGQVWAYVRPQLGRTVLAWLLLSTLLVVGMVVLGGALALVGPGFVVLLFFPLMWIAVCLTLYFPVLWMEEGSALGALQRSFYLIKGKWWSTLGLYMVMSMITGTMNYLFIIPVYGLMAVRMLKIPGFESELFSVATMSFYSLGVIFTAVLPLVAMLFQYFNLVERKDGLGLRLLVDSLGQTAAPQVTSTTYRPDEEGEY